MSRSACEIALRHEWVVVLDEDGWLPVRVRCAECGRVVLTKARRDDEEHDL